MTVGIAELLVSLRENPMHIALFIVAGIGLMVFSYWASK